MSDQNCPSLLSSPSFQTKQSQQIQSVNRMIQMLKNYESNCLQKGNFYQAEASKIRITQLKQQQLKAQHQELKLKNKENIEQVDRKNEHEINLFHEIWQVRIKQHMQEYKLIQDKLKQDHKRQLDNIQFKMRQQFPSKIKYSPTVLKLKNHLQNLIKCKMYIEAEHTSQQLKSLQAKQNQIWICKFQQKKRKQLDQIIKKQQTQSKALKIKIKSMFNQKMKEKQQLFNKLLNKIQKRKVQSSKCPIELINKQKEVSKRMGSRSNSLNKTNLWDSRSRVYTTIKE